MQPNVSSETKTSAARSRRSVLFQRYLRTNDRHYIAIYASAKHVAIRVKSRKPLVVTKHSGLNESDASSESGTEDVLSVNSSEPDTTCLPKGVYFSTVEKSTAHYCKEAGPRT